MQTVVCFSPTHSCGNFSLVTPGYVLLSTQMDKYVKVRMIGEGSFGKALLVRRKDDSKQYVIKQINTSKVATAIIFTLHELTPFCASIDGQQRERVFS